MKNIFKNENGAALVVVLLAIVVVSILFTTLMGMQVSEMKGQTKFEENLKNNHKIVGAIDEVTFYIIQNYDSEEEFGVLCQEAKENLFSVDPDFKNEVECNDTDQSISAKSNSNISRKLNFSFE